ncbi:MAG: response regulator [Bacteroidales bacterium]|nr:response regulator [Bacteroidales bacterium]
MSISERQTVLIVDDAESITEFIKQLLEEHGYSAVGCGNGVEALRLAVEIRPDLILLDIMMPDVDGYAICAQLKADNKTKDIPVIFLSALNSSFDKVKAFKCGAVDYITKPVQNDELMARVKTHLTISNLHHSLLSCNRDLEEKIRERTQNLETENENLRSLNAIMEKTLVKYRNQSDMTDEEKKLRRTFLEDIRQELLTPLQSIYGFAGIIGSGGMNEEKIKEYSNAIETNAQYLCTSFDKIIQFSLHKIDPIKPNPTNVDVSALIYEICSLRKPTVDHKNIQLVLKDSLGNQNLFFTDHTMLSCIIENLIDNAIEFTKEGSIELRASHDKGSFVFCIKDTGIGINPEKIDILFNPLGHNDKASTRGYAFATIGLALVKEFIETLQGQIWIDSTPGRGTEFYISLPADALKNTMGDNNIFANKTIIVADDDDVSYILLSEAIKHTGLKIRRAKDGRELFEMFRLNPTPLIITNLKLPVMNGTEALKIIKKMSPETIAIAQMPYFSAVDKRNYSNSLCDGFIEKPAKQEQIIEVLKKYLIN